MRAGGLWGVAVALRLASLCRADESVCADFAVPQLSVFAALQPGGDEMPFAHIADAIDNITSVLATDGFANIFNHGFFSGDKEKERQLEYLLGLLRLQDWLNSTARRLSQRCADEGPRLCWKAEFRSAYKSSHRWIAGGIYREYSVRLDSGGCWAALAALRRVPDFRRLFLPSAAIWAELRDNCSRLCAGKSVRWGELPPTSDKADAWSFRCGFEAAVEGGWGRLGEWWIWVLGALWSSAALGVVVVGLLFHWEAEQLWEDLDLRDALVFEAEALGLCKWRDGLLLNWASRVDLPALVWDEYDAAYQEFRRCPLTAVTAFDFWGWAEALEEAPVDIGRPESGPKLFNVALHIPFAKLVDVGLASAIQWRSEDPVYDTYFGLDTKAALPSDKPDKAATPLARLLRKPQTTAPMSPLPNDDSVDSFYNKSAAEPTTQPTQPSPDTAR